MYKVRNQTKQRETARPSPNITKQISTHPSRFLVVTGRPMGLSGPIFLIFIYNILRTLMPLPLFLDIVFFIFFSFTSFLFFSPLLDFSFLLFLSLLFLLCLQNINNQELIAPYMSFFHMNCNIYGK